MTRVSLPSTLRTRRGEMIAAAGIPVRSRQRLRSHAGSFSGREKLKAPPAE